MQGAQSSSRTAVDGRRTVVVLVRTGRRQGRLDEDGPRPTTVRLPPLEGRSSTTFFTLIFYSYFLFLFLFSALTYLSTSTASGRKDRELWKLKVRTRFLNWLEHTEPSNQNPRSPIHVSRSFRPEAVNSRSVTLNTLSQRSPQPYTNPLLAQHKAHPSSDLLTVLGLKLKIGTE